MTGSCVLNCMPQLRLHRASRTILSLVLLLSSVGLPVMVVACGMDTMVRSECCTDMCPSTAGEGSLSVSNIPCRAEIHFIERNTTAYVPVKPAGEQPALKILLIVPDSYVATGSPVSFSCNPTSSPPVPRDNIHILISSFLI